MEEYHEPFTTVDFQLGLLADTGEFGLVNGHTGL